MTNLCISESADTVALQATPTNMSAGIADEGSPTQPLTTTTTCKTPPPIYTRPDPVTQRPVNSTSRDRKNYKRHILGGVISEKVRGR